MFTDVEVAMSMAHNRSLRAFGRDAQALVNELDDDIVGLRIALVRERALRVAAELKLARLNRLLDTPIN